jgi:hypothetical protein
MLFSDKLKTLMDITHTSNKTLAKHLIVDPSMISQLRTGARNISKKNDHLQNMSEYFASRCCSESRIMELQDVIDDDSLNSECTVTELSDIIFRFLSDDSMSKVTSHKVIAEIFKSNPRIRRTELKPLDLPERSLMVCHNIDEKKEYMKMLFEYYMSLEKPDVVYFASEEIVDWIYNDEDYYNNFRSWCLSLIEKGFTFIRIMKPMENKEHFLNNTLLWLPIYLTGGVHLYYYPHFRDDIFRQTIITVNNSASYFSSSIAKTDTCYYSFMSTNPSLSSAYVRQIKDYLALCIPSLDVFTTKQEMADAFSHLLSLTGDRITKSFNLTSESMPYSEMLEYMSMSDNEAYRSAAKVMTRLYSTRQQSENKSSIIEMCSLASTEDILEGRVRLFVPGFVSQTPIYYDANLYAMHLRHILYLLNSNPNYHFYPLDAKDFGEYGNDYAPTSIVDGQTVIITNEQVMLHFTQHDIIRTLYEDLFHQAMVRKKYLQKREEVVAMINERLNSITKA